jgi:hypothetical protein
LFNIHKISILLVCSHPCRKKLGLHLTDVNSRGWNRVSIPSLHTRPHYRCQHLHEIKARYNQLPMIQEESKLLGQTIVLTPRLLLYELTVEHWALL